ncbi:MAG TPA: response regulator transcription factor [Terriglobales bacterium]|nr:response regulator transcription factor [Terriglobales bacterium]
MSTRMVLSSDYTITREGLRSLFREAPEVAIVGEAESVIETPQKVREFLPDVVLIEISVPGRAPGLRAVAEITDYSPESRVIVLTNNTDLPYARSMLARGASGYLSKNTDTSQLFTAVRNVTSGGRFIDPTLGNDLVWHVVERKRRAVRPILSRRELEVLKALVRGLTNTQAAHLLKLNVKTVETYRSRIYRKLHVRSRAEIVEYASLHRLFTERD